MRILWITNIIFPEALSLLNHNCDHKSSGGWMLGAASALVDHCDLELIVATVSPLVKELKRLDGEKIVYYLLPYGKGNIKYNKGYEPLWKKVRNDVHPDIIHIHGTEFTHGLAYVRACGSENVVVSIQGLVGECSRFYHYGINTYQLFRNITLRNFLRRGILVEKHSFEKRGALERELLQRVHHVIGRTTWDKSHLWAINSQAYYYHVGETLRGVFYEGRWDYSKCNQHSIFLSQGNYPLKGLHMVLEALPYVLKQFPDTKLRIAGKDITRFSSIKDIFYYTDYGHMIHRQIKRLSLENLVSFTGPLNAEEMKKEYLKTNLFICPSSIENSPNSLGEAQILGVPCISAYVGGVPDFMEGDEEHLYRFEDVEVMAKKICLLFEAKDNQPQVERMRKRALLRHDSVKNSNELLCVYNMMNAR